MSNKKILRLTLQIFSFLFLVAGTFMLFCNQLKITGSIFDYKVVLFGGVKHTFTFLPAIPSTIGYIAMSVCGILGLVAGCLSKKKALALTIVTLVLTGVCIALVFMTGFFFSTANVAYCSDRAISLVQGPILGGVFASVAFALQALSLVFID